MQHNIVMVSIFKHIQCCSSGQNEWRGGALELDARPGNEDIYGGAQWLFVGLSGYVHVTSIAW